MKIIFSYLCGIALVLTVSCTTTPLKAFNYVSNQDDFFAVVSEVISNDQTHTYTRVSGDSVSFAVRSKVRNAAFRTDNTFVPGYIYKHSFQDKGVSYTLFMLDAVEPQNQEVTTAGGSTIPSVVGLKACKWALYQVSP
jgi:hypothetical protein